MDKDNETNKMDEIEEEANKKINEPVEIVESAEPAKSSEPVKLVKLVKSVEAAELADSDETTESVKSDENETDDSNQTSEAVISTEYGDITIQKPKESAYKKYIAIATGIVAVVVIVAFFMMTQSSKGGGIVSNAWATTFAQMGNEGKKLAKYPNLLAYKGDGKDISEQELSLLVKNIDLGDTEYASIVSMLNGLELKMNMKSDITNLNYLYSLDLLNGDTSLINGNIYMNSGNIAVNSPALFTGLIGVNSQSSEELRTYFESLKTIYTYNENLEIGLLSTAKIVQKAFEEIEQKIAFKENKEESNDQNQVFYGEVEGNTVLEIYKKYLLEALKDEKVKKMVESVYDQLGKSELTRLDGLDFATMEDDLIKDIDLAIAENMLENIKVKASIDKKAKTLSDITISAVVDATEVTINMKPEVKDKYVNIIANFEMKHEGESVNYNMSILNHEKEKDVYEMDATIGFALSEDEALSMQIGQTFNDVDKTYAANAQLSLQDYGYTTSLDANVDGVYSEVEGVNMMTFDDFSLRLYDDEYEEEYIAEFSGYIKKNKIDSIPEMKAEEIKLIDEMSEEEVRNLEDEMLSNLQTSELFRYIIMKQFGL